jgi:hypothetical protein
MKAGAGFAAMILFALAGCGGGSGKTSSTSAASPTVPTGQPSAGAVTGKLPHGSVGPPDVQEEHEEGAAATEASPGETPVGPEASGELSGDDSSAVTGTVAAYIRALDRHDAAGACRSFAPGALDLGLLPKRRGGCVPSMRASIGTAPRGGAPAWRRTTLVEVKPEDLGDGRARVSATVTHHFSDRKYVSVEDDVIYLQKSAGRWQLAKPSATFYRAVGYDSPPLAAFTPPAGW